MNIKTFVLIVILLGMVAYGGYYLGNKNKLVSAPATTLPVPTGTAAISATPTGDDTALLLAAIKQALVAEHGATANELTITVSKIQGNYAQGGAAAQAGGAMWFAEKQNGVWKLVWDGNGTISCDVMDKYPEFPNTMIPECWNDKTMKSVAR
jgi:hypothetical protein